jgi:hypothetical protein
MLQLEASPELAMAALPNGEKLPDTGLGENGKADAGKKKGDVKKLSVELADYRTDGAATKGETPLRNEAVPVKEMLVELKGAAAGSAISTATESRPVSFEQFRNADVKSAEQMSSFLSRELHNNLNGDIVRHASVMLRDGGEGLIRLRLHPASLGNVNVRLSLSGNKVEGVITVESAEAYSAFESEKAALETAFRESGFDGASLNMLFAGGGNGAAPDGERAGSFSRAVAASEYESRTITAGLSDTGSSYFAHEGLSILA